VRYADDYLIAVKGPKSLARDIQKKTQDFLKSNLHFSLKGGGPCSWGLQLSAFPKIRY